MTREKVKKDVTKDDASSEVESMGDKSFITLGVYFDKKVNKYVQVKLMHDPESQKTVTLSTKTLTANRNLAIMSSCTIDLVKLMSNELE
jgi:hypothetical protein